MLRHALSQNATELIFPVASAVLRTALPGQSVRRERLDGKAAPLLSWAVVPSKPDTTLGAFTFAVHVHSQITAKSWAIRWWGRRGRQWGWWKGWWTRLLRHALSQNTRELIFPVASAVLRAALPGQCVRRERLDGKAAPLLCWAIVPSESNRALPAVIIAVSVHGPIAALGC